MVQEASKRSPIAITLSTRDSERERERGRERAREREREREREGATGMLEFPNRIKQFGLGLRKGSLQNHLPPVLRVSNDRPL
jgi:hypothetical protein